MAARMGGLSVRRSGKSVRRKLSREGLERHGVGDYLQVVKTTNPQFLRRTLLRIAASALAVGGAAVPAAAMQQSTSREVVQALPSVEVQRLNRALMELARSPRSVGAMLEAGDASLEVGDLDAAVGFYGRAADLAPDNPRVKLGLARVYLRSGRPTEAIPLFREARAAGAQPADLLGDEGLALDMIGNHSAAQSAYDQALALRPQDDEVRRRLALSHAIAGDQDRFQEVLAPLLEARDMGAFRARAFGLAILGKQERAEGIVDAVMPTDLAARITPYLAFMPRLTPPQQAAAANLGIFPRAADIGRENPRIARFASEGAAGARLEPAGEPFGAPEPNEAVSNPVVQDAPPPTPQRMETSAAATAETTGATLPADPAQPLPRIATSETLEMARPSSSVAAAFADMDATTTSAPMPSRSRSDGAVDLAAIDIPREAAAAPEAPAVPDHPRRIWVQLATGRDVTALGFDWRRFARQAPELLEGFAPHVTPWGEANRLLAGPLEDRAAARRLINALAEKGIETFSYTNPEGTQIQTLAR
jgi:Flp pilus assembly protein TadD